MLGILFPSLKVGKNCKTFLAFAAFPRYATFSPFSPICKIFPIIGQCRFFLTSGIGPDILVKVFEGYIILLISADCILLNFYYKQKQRFSVWSFAEITSFISFHEGILSITKNTKTCRFQLGNLSSITKTKNKS